MNECIAPPPFSFETFMHHDDEWSNMYVPVRHHPHALLALLNGQSSIVHDMISAGTTTTSYLLKNHHNLPFVLRAEIKVKDTIYQQKVVLRAEIKVKDTINKGCLYVHLSGQQHLNMLKFICVID
jgi:hypothetical protein